MASSPGRKLRLSFESARHDARIINGDVPASRREKQHQRQRIILFVGSPVSESKEALVKIAKKLKKNNVAVDLVLFGSGA